MIDRRIAYGPVDPLVSEVSRQIFESGRFDAQTADLTYGPFAHGLLEQHQQLATQRYENAVRRGIAVGFTMDRIERFYTYGFNYYGNVQRRRLAQR